jgi:hypothetical protein
LNEVLSAHTSQNLQVVELDPLVAELAKKYFGFSMDEQLKVGCHTPRIRESPSTPLSNLDFNYFPLMFEKFLPHCFVNLNFDWPVEKLFAFALVPAKYHKGTVIFYGRR